MELSVNDVRRERWLARERTVFDVMVTTHLILLIITFPVNVVYNIIKELYHKVVVPILYLFKSVFSAIFGKIISILFASIVGGIIIWKLIIPALMYAMRHIMIG